MAGDSAREVARRQREKAARLAQSAERWERGADGEAATAAALDELSRRGWTLFHDVRWPGRQRANIDHIAVGPSGVFVIDSKNWSGDVRVIGDVLHQGTRRREREVAAAAEAALAVTQLLQGTPATPVLCFVRPEPVDGWARDVMVCSTQNLAAKLVAQPTVLGPDSASRVTTILQWHLTSAQMPVAIRRRTTTRRLPPTRPSSGRQPATAVGRTLRRAMLVVVAVVFSLIVLGVGIGLIGAVLGSIGDLARPGAAPGTGTARTQTSSAPTLGEAVRLPEGTSHPALSLTADKVLPVASTALPSTLQQGQHLVAVRYSIRNDGTQLWGATSPYLRFSALMSNGQYAPGALNSAVAPNKLMPAAFNLRPGMVRRGFVVFTVPKGVKLVRVSATAGLGSRDAVEWLIP